MLYPCLNEASLYCRGGSAQEGITVANGLAGRIKTEMMHTEGIVSCLQAVLNMRI